MAKIWQKNYDLDEVIERFTVGNDPVLDVNLLEADVLGSIAHAKMLSEVGILTEDEFASLRSALSDVLSTAESGSFSISVEQEDVHTALEEHLVEKLSDLGKKIHTARSRNDQAALDMRLFARERILEVGALAVTFAGACLKFAEKHADVPIVGRTHTQRAMASSVGLWASAFAEAMIEDIELLMHVYEQVNRSPLGSAASYGVALPIKRERTAELLGMKPITNVLYANNTRGKVEATALFALSQVMSDLAKMAGDTILFSIPEFGYFTLPDKYCPGSSIMPQKKNPGPLELVRAKVAVVQGGLFTVLGVTRGLYSGYNRDLQETKGPLMQGFTITADALTIMNLILGDMTVNVEACRQAFTPEVFAADAANELVEQGMPFRDAYRQVGLNLSELAERDPVENIKSKKHLGATGNLGLDILRTRLDALSDSVITRTEWILKVKRSLLST